MKKIDYYVSINSPWVYLGNDRLRAIAEKHGAAVNVKLPDFSEVFSKTGGLPLPQRSAERQKYRLMELVRWKKHLDMPLNLKPKHSGVDLSVAKTLVLMAKRSGQDSLGLLGEFGRSLWALDEDVSKESVIAEIVKRAGVNMDLLRIDVPSATVVKATFEDHTKDALAAGVFGAPSYVLPTGEVFWGQDRLEFLDRALD